MTTPVSEAERYLRAYAALRLRFDDLLRAADGSVPVRACPGWTVRDVLAHLVGLCDDWNDSRLEGYATESWTANQVARYADYSVADLLARWTRSLVVFERLDDHRALGPPARWAFRDAIIHEADVRGALGAGRPPHEAVLLHLEGTIVRWQQVLNDAELPMTLRLRTTDGPEWTLAEPNADTCVTVTPSVYELFRALAGRRSEEQVRAWNWSADPDAILRLGLPYPFHWAAIRMTD